MAIIERESISNIAHLNSIIAGVDDVNVVVRVVGGYAFRGAEHANATAFLPDAAQVLAVLGKHVDAVLPFV